MRKSAEEYKVSWKETYLSEVERQMLYCILECPRRSEELRGRFNVSLPDMKKSIRTLQRYGLIEKVGRNSQKQNTWAISSQVLSRMEWEARGKKPRFVRFA